MLCAPAAPKRLRGWAACAHQLSGCMLLDAPHILLLQACNLVGVPALLLSLFPLGAATITCTLLAAATSLKLLRPHVAALIYASWELPFRSHVGP